MNALDARYPDDPKLSILCPLCLLVSGVQKLQLSCQENKHVSFERQ